MFNIAYEATPIETEKTYYNTCITSTIECDNNKFVFLYIDI